MGMVDKIEKAEKEKAADDVTKNLSPDRIEYLKQYLNTESETFGNKAKSGKVVGWDSRKTLAEHKTLLPLIQEKLDTQGLDLDYIVEKLKEGCEAKFTEFAKFEGAITDARDCVDHGMRHKYLQTVMNIHKVLGKDVEKSRATQINIILPVNRPNSKDCNNVENAEYQIHKTVV